MSFPKSKTLVIVDWENLRKMIEGDKKKGIQPGKRLKVNFNYPEQVYKLIQSFIEEDEEVLRILFYYALLPEEYRPPEEAEDNNNDKLLKELRKKQIFNKKYILDVRERNFVSVFRSQNGEEKRIIHPEKIPINYQIITDNTERFRLKRISSYHFIERLRKLNNITCRLGYLSLDTLEVYYKLNDGNIEDKLRTDLTQGKLKVYTPRQKLVDVLMGIDIVNYSLKRLVDRIIVFCNDTDILPAVKEAKRNGIKVIMTVFREYINTLNKQLIEHFDEIRPR